jgi:hypothetical protein
MSVFSPPRSQRLSITDRRTPYHHQGGNCYFERFHRTLKEEEVWTAETSSPGIQTYQDLAQLAAPIHFLSNDVIRFLSM